MSEHDFAQEEASITVELALFANIRQVVGSKFVERTYPENNVRIGDILRDLEEEYPGLTFFDEEGNVREYISILKNGTDIVHMEGPDTIVESGDRISLFPPVAGGGMNRTFWDSTQQGGG